MGHCLSKTKKKTTKSKNFGTVNFELTNKHTVSNVLGTKDQTPKGSTSWKQHWVKNSGQDLPPYCPICLKYFEKKIVKYLERTSTSVKERTKLQGLKNSSFLLATGISCLNYILTSR